MRAMSVAKRIESGICHANGPTLPAYGSVSSPEQARFRLPRQLEKARTLRTITKS
mgnify:CR=1 FL=1